MTSGRKYPSGAAGIRCLPHSPIHVLLTLTSRRRRAASPSQRASVPTKTRAAMEVQRGRFIPGVYKGETVTVPRKVPKVLERALEKAGKEAKGKPFVVKRVSRGMMCDHVWCRVILKLPCMKKHTYHRSTIVTFESPKGEVWKLSFQRDGHTITNGWREFAFDLDLKLKDYVFFIRIACLHFVVRVFDQLGREKSNASISRKYPWACNYRRRALILACQAQIISEDFPSAGTKIKLEGKSKCNRSNCKRSNCKAHASMTSSGEKLNAVRVDNNVSRDKERCQMEETTEPGKKTKLQRRSKSYNRTEHASKVPSGTNAVRVENNVGRRERCRLRRMEERTFDLDYIECSTPNGVYLQILDSDDELDISGSPVKEEPWSVQGSSYPFLKSQLQEREEKEIDTIFSRMCNASSGFAGVRNDWHAEEL